MFAVLNTTRAAVRRSGPAMAVTAFASLSARRSSSSTFAAKPTPSSSSRKLFAARPFLQSPQHQQQRGGSPSILARQRQSTLASSAATMETDTLIHQKKVDLLKSFDTTHPAYDVINKDFVSEYGAYCTLYRHRKSGAELLSVAVDDDNKVFGITLRTPPEDSTGVPHILEHSVLCGSRKYKTKDPFVHLLKGSLQTFLNAFTYPDRTCYVVASQNEKDFYNLVNVYADAVYQPRAVNDPLVLAQEGWHLELDDEGKLIYNGVV